MFSGPTSATSPGPAATPSPLISDFRDRVACLHIKDVQQAGVRSALAANADYSTATLEHEVWAEPGRGDVDFDGIFQELGSGFSGCVDGALRLVVSGA